jgi:hypothetical protein
MQIVIAHQTGRIHHAVGHSALQKNRPTYAFLPDGFVVGGGFAKAQYLVSRWPSINAGANPHAIGSHIIPDASKPVSPRSHCLILREFLARLKTIAAVKAIPPTV